MPEKTPKGNEGHRKRVRERVSRDPSLVPQYELLELLLGYVHRRGDTKPLAKNLLARFSSIRGILSAREAELLEIEQMGPSTLFFFQLLREIIARAMAEDIQETRRPVTMEDICDLARTRLSGNCVEEVWAALLDNGNRLITFERVCVGTVNKVLVTPRMVVELALKRNATGIVLVHNHPGGNVSPSVPDLELTKTFGNVLHGMNIRLLDHLIFADGAEAGSAVYSLVKDKLLGGA